MTDPSGPRPSDRFIPWYIVIFFVVQGAGFAWFYHLAHSTYTGVVTDNAYEKGLQYNNIISKSDAQDKLGWTSSFTRKNGALELSLHEKGRPLSRADVKLWFIRPVHAGIDQHLVMKETSNGIYTAPIHLPEKGLWDVRIEAVKDGRVYQAAQRMEF